MLSECFGNELFAFLAGQDNQFSNVAQIVGAELWGHLFQLQPQSLLPAAAEVRPQP